MHDLPRIPPIKVHMIMLLMVMMTIQGNTHSKTIARAGSGSASSLVRSMKNARDDPQASENTDTMTLNIIVHGK